MSAFALATLNATLNATSALCVLLGFRAIRRKEVKTHRALMLAAFTASTLFLVSYVSRMLIYGETRFSGQSGVRYVYFAILISHVVLALAVVPMVLRSLYLGLRMRTHKHRRIARFTFPIWTYVSVTGVIVYLMLYHWPR